MNCGVCNHRKVCRCFPNPEEYCSDYEPERSHGEWEYSIVDCYKSGYLCPRCKGFAVIEGKSDGYSVTFCPNCGSRNRTEENNSSSMVIDGKYSENVEYGTRVEKKEGE